MLSLHNFQAQHKHSAFRLHKFRSQRNHNYHVSSDTFVFTKPIPHLKTLWYWYQSSTATHNDSGGYVPYIWSFSSVTTSCFDSTPEPYVSHIWYFFIGLHPMKAPESFQSYCTSKTTRVILDERLVGVGCITLRVYSSLQILINTLIYLK